MKKTIPFVCALLVSAAAYAQNQGYVTGSLETNNNLYVQDEANSSSVKDDRFGSNNYLKLDYYNNRFSAGLQLEGYLPALTGYPSELSKVALSNIYVNWSDEDFSITAGTFYDQFGSGLLFRSWEDRTLGLNNAICGVRAAYNYQNMVSVKALWGMPRFGMSFSDTQVRGADLSVSVADIIGLDDVALSVEGSVLNRYEKISDTMIEADGSSNQIGWSGRVNFDYSGFFAKLEYVDAGKKLISKTPKKGNAQLVELGYNGRGLGVTLTGRRLEWMTQSINSFVSSPSNLMSYVPAMCTQYTYMLTTLHPYNPQVGDALSFLFNSGEVGGQLDAFYNFRRGTAIGGKRGMKVHANFSTYYTLENEGGVAPGNMLFRDFSLDVEKQWTKEFKMILLYSMQEYNPTYGQYKTTWLSNIFVADLLYKFTPRFSTRLELQYLTTHEDKKDWIAALLEVNFAPNWSIWGSDMWNHGSTKMHYYNAGVSYAKGRTRVALGYGRYKAGMICSGGVCRTIPAYTGGNLSVTTSF